MRGVGVVLLQGDGVRGDDDNLTVGHKMPQYVIFLLAVTRTHPLTTHKLVAIEIIR